MCDVDAHVALDWAVVRALEAREEVVLEQLSLAVVRESNENVVNMEAELDVIHPVRPCVEGVAGVDRAEAL